MSSICHDCPQLLTFNPFSPGGPSGPEGPSSPYIGDQYTTFSNKSDKFKSEKSHRILSVLAGKYHGKVFDTKVQLSILITKFMACIQCLPIIDTKNAICFLALFKRKALGTWTIFIFYAVSDLPALQAHQGVLFHQFHPEINRY